MKGKVTVDIKHSDYVYIDGATGETLTKQEFNAKHSKGIRNLLGKNGASVPIEEGEGEEDTN